MKTASTLSRALSLIAAAGLSMALLQSVATLPVSMPTHGYGPVMAQGSVQVAAAGQVATR